MPKYCCVYGCNNDLENHKDLSFHSFPSNQQQAKAWKIRIRREDFKPSGSSYVCSKHFTDQDFTDPRKDTPEIFQKKRLKRRVIPSRYLRGNFEEVVKKRKTNTAARAIRPQQAEVMTANENDAESYESDSLHSNQHQQGTEQDQMPIRDDNDDTKVKLEELRKELASRDQMIKMLDKKLFVFENLSNQDIKNYTNLTKDAFLALDELFGKFRPFSYWSGSEVTQINDKNQLLICLMKLKLDVPFFDLAKRFNVSRTTIHNIFMTNLQALNEILYDGMMKTIPSLAKNGGSLPESYAKFTNCRIIIDCTEFKITTPRRDLNAAAASYSNYKHNLTGKFLIGVAPNGSITFVSEGFPGNTSDKMVTDQCGVLNQLQVGAGSSLLQALSLKKIFQWMLSI